MWTFGSTTRKIRRLEEEIKALERSLEGLRGLPLQWEDTLDRLQKLVGRLNAREKALRASESEDLQGGQPSGPPKIGTHAHMQEWRRRRGLLHG